MSDMVRLDRFDNGGFDRGRSRLVEGVWALFDLVLVRSGLPGSSWRRALLRLFGAKIGDGVVIKARVAVKFPWRLEIGAHSWIGEGAWIDNLALVSIGAHVCVSQGAYLCTGSHDWSRPAFDLVTKPIRIEDSAWICAKAVIGPGVTIGRGAVVGLGAVATRDVPQWRIVGARDEELKVRTVMSEPDGRSCD